MTVQRKTEGTTFSDIFLHLDFDLSLSGWV